MYARTGTLTHLVNARRWALHHRRDQIHLSGASIGHPRCPGGYLNNTRYTFPQGLIQDFFMFGDEEARNVSGIIVDNFYMPHAAVLVLQGAEHARILDRARGGVLPDRHPGALRGHGECGVPEPVRDRVASLHRMQVDNGRRAWVHNLYDHDPSEGCARPDYGSSPWMSGLLLEAIVKYHKMTNDPIARESILMAVDDLRARYLATGVFAGVSFIYLGCPVYSDGAPDLDNLISHAFGYAYRLTGTESLPDARDAPSSTPRSITG